MRKWIAIVAAGLLSGCSLMPEDPGTEAINDGLRAVFAGIANSLEIITSGAGTAEGQTTLTTESLDGSARFEGTGNLTSTTFWIEGKVEFDDHYTSYHSHRVSGSIEYRHAEDSDGTIMMTTDGMLTFQGGSVDRLHLVDLRLTSYATGDGVICTGGYVVADTWFRHEADALLTESMIQDMASTGAQAAETGRSVRTVQAAIERLGYPTTGRDYVLIPEQARAVIAEMRDGPGRPHKEGA